MNLSETLKDIGEFGLIRRIDALLKREGVQAPGVTLGIGDDTASFKARHGCEVLVTCDCVVEGRHFLPGHIRPIDLGRRSMMLNISDIGAMGGHPLYALVSLGLKNETLLRDIEDLYRGFLSELNPFSASIIGGNLTKSGDGIFIDITLLGEVEEGRAVRRSGARPGGCDPCDRLPGAIGCRASASAAVFGFGGSPSGESLQQSLSSSPRRKSGGAHGMCDGHDRHKRRVSGGPRAHLRNEQSGGSFEPGEVPDQQ